MITACDCVARDEDCRRCGHAPTAHARLYRGRKHVIARECEACECSEYRGAPCANDRSSVRG